MKAITIGTLAAIALGVGATAWYTSRTKPVEVTLAPVQRGAVHATVSNTRAGTVDACQRAKMAPVMGGQISSLPVNEGDEVVANQILLELWNADLRAQRHLADQEKHAAEARAVEVCTAADVAQRESNRAERLRAQGLTSEEHADITTGKAQASQAACQAMRDMVKVSEARVKLSDAHLEQTMIRAPFTGTVAQINGEVGEVVTPSPVGVATLPAVDLIDSSCIYVTAPIDEVDAPAIRAGMSATIALDAFPDTKFKATVRRVAPFVLDHEKQARTVDIEAEFDTPSDNLLPGYSADVEVTLDVRQDVLHIPTRSLLRDGRVLLLNEEGILEQRAVKTGLSNWQVTEITQGLTQSDRVVLSVDREGVVPGAQAIAQTDTSEQ